MTDRLLRSSGDKSDFVEMGPRRANGKQELSQSAFDQLKAEKKKIMKELETVRVEAKEKEKKIEELNDFKKKLELEKQEFDAKKSNMEQEMNELKLQLHEKYTQLAKVEKKFKKLKDVKYENLKTLLDDKNEKIEGLERSIQKKMNQLTSLKDELEIANSKVEGLLKTKKYSDAKNRALLKELQVTKDSFIEATLRKEGIRVPTRQYVDYHNPRNDDYHPKNTAYLKSHRSSPYERR